MEPLIRSVSERIKDEKPPGWLTVWRDYRKWIASGRDVRAIVLRHADRGKSGASLTPEVRPRPMVIDELYMTEERKRVPEVHLEIVRRLTDANKLRRVTPHFRFQADGRSTVRLHGDRHTNSWWHDMANAAPKWNLAYLAPVPKLPARSRGCRWITLPAT